jgi:eukaryotic-like serine/threonine-protein kinase
MPRIGQYEIGELLGEGGIGQVHAAFDTVLKREVAIKSLRPEMLRDASSVARFRSEATSLARLNHPNVTTVHALVEDGATLYIVMERVRGETVQDLLLRRKGPLRIEQSLAVIGQAAEGLSYAHSMGVIHRDIKPANLMVTRDGLVKIMDFGIARARGSQRLTRDGSIIGTLAYMAPEQLRGEAGDERSDLYSLAVVLYEMLSGSAPFSAATEYDLMQAQLHARPRRLSSLVPGIDVRVERALLQALAKKPDQRFESVKAFRKALGVSAARLEASTPSGDTGRTAPTGKIGSRLPSLPSWFDRRPHGLAGSRIAILAGAAVIAAALLWLGALTLIPSEPTVAMNDRSARPPASSALGSGTSRSSASGASRKEATAHESIILPPTSTRAAPPIVLPRQ